jgi:hypothetical protein
MTLATNDSNYNDWRGTAILCDELECNRISFRTYVNSSLLFGAGTTSSKVDMGATGTDLIRLTGSTTATSGLDSRAIYARIYFGAAGGGEALRAYGTVNNATVAVAGTVTALTSLYRRLGFCAVSGAARFPPYAGARASTNGWHY